MTRKTKIQKLRGMKRIASITDRVNSLMTELDQGASECRSEVDQRKEQIVRINEEIAELDQAAKQAGCLRLALGAALGIDEGD